jgi:hypothetical protein
MKRLRNRFGLQGFVGLDSEEMSGGLALYWHESLLIDVEEVNNRFIDVLVRTSINDPQWRLTCVYGEPRVDVRISCGLKFVSFTADMTSHG